MKAIRRWSSTYRPVSRLEVAGWALEGPRSVGLILREVNGEASIGLDVYGLYGGR